MKKLHFIFINVVTFVLIATLLFLPMFILHDQNDGLKITIFGYHFVTGYTIDTGASGINQFSPVLISKLLGLVPAMMLLSIFAIDKLTKANFGKDMINFLASAITLIYTFLLPITSYTFITDLYDNTLVFTPVAGLWINIALLSLTTIYYLIVLIISIKKNYNEVKEKESAKNELTEEANKENTQIQ